MSSKQFIVLASSLLAVAIVKISAEPPSSYGPPGYTPSSTISGGGSGPKISFSSGGSGGGGNYYSGGEGGAPEPYSYIYEVKDAPTGNDYSAQANSDGKRVTGEYRVLLPDGRRQIVKYTADDGGYNANVVYEGQARYPVTVPRVINSVGPTTIIATASPGSSGGSIVSGGSRPILSGGSGTIVSGGSGTIVAGGNSGSSFGGYRY